MSEILYNFIMGLSATFQWILLPICIVGGILVLVKGADYLVKSASNIAKVLKIPALVVGLTIVAFGTSAPEASVSIVAAINGSAGISVGNIVGSNLMNLLIVLGMSIVVMPFTLSKKVVIRDVGMLLISGMLLVFFCFVFSTNTGRSLVWFEGLILFVAFIVYLVFFIREEIRTHKINEIDSKEIVNQGNGQIEKSLPIEDQKNPNIWVSIITFVISLLGVILGGDILNCGAKGVAVNLGVSENLAGLTVCAIGTSLPELVTSIIAIKRKQNDIAIGNVIGSNLFNVMAILGICAMITPFALDIFAMVDIVILGIVYLVFFVYCLFAKNLSRFVGIIMLSAYFLFFIFIILREIYPIL